MHAGGPCPANGLPGPQSHGVLLPWVVPGAQAGVKQFRGRYRGAELVPWHACCACWAVQGGIHPDFTGDSYLRLLEAAKTAAPGIHVHAFR